MLSAACSALPRHANVAGCKNCCQATSPRLCSCSSSSLLATPTATCRTQATMEETCSLALEQPQPQPAAGPAASKYCFGSGNRPLFGRSALVPHLAAPKLLAVERRPAFHIAPACGWINGACQPAKLCGSWTGQRIFWLLCTQSRSSLSLCFGWWLLTFVAALPCLYAGTIFAPYRPKR